MTAAPKRCISGPPAPHHVRLQIPQFFPFHLRPGSHHPHGDPRAGGEEGFRHLEEYIDAHTERYARMVDGICKNLRVTSLRYQTLEGMLASIGIDPEQVCTYCWTGRE